MSNKKAELNQGFLELLRRRWARVLHMCMKAETLGDEQSVPNFVHEEEIILVHEYCMRAFLFVQLMPDLESNSQFI
jgi:hypothetical protein